MSWWFLRRKNGKTEWVAVDINLFLFLVLFLLGFIAFLAAIHGCLR
ncbi:MAG: hypothetical protein HY706_04940 [Candidatus Hydrogenedentes bacterium]|nr:hypothetical protein [Candidatus Hydrogenedentota bacterium]